MKRLHVILDEWEEGATTHGIYIKHDPAHDVLKSHGKVNVDVWVYANTWGYYLDEIVIEIGEIEPFRASIIVEVVGSPLELPFARNTIREEPILR